MPKLIIEAGFLVKKTLTVIGWPVYKTLKWLVRVILKLGNKLSSIRLKKTKKIPSRVSFSGWWLAVKRVTFGVLVILLVVTGVIVYQGFKEIEKDFPDINRIYSPPKMSSKVTDRKGNLLYTFYVNENRSWTPIEKIPESLIWSTLSIEDKDFFNHHGFSVRGILNAVWYNIRSNGDRPRGGSTLTQQLAKNIFLTNEKTWDRKIKETLLSILIEQRLSKRDILERYFNQVPYGGETYGVEEAALKYFGKHVWEITMAEASFLAGLPAAPSSYYPYGPNKNLAFARQRHVIDEMVEAGYISLQSANDLKQSPITIIEEKHDINAPHFVFFIKDYLEKHGFLNFEGQGLTIKTSLDLDIQNQVQETVKSEVDKVSRLRISNGAALVVDVKTGDVLAMVGSKDYDAKDIDGKYNVTTALRQPGSSIKPVNYLVALRKGWTMSSAIDDAPVSYQIKGQKPYSPQNYNGKYMGRVNLKTALASSLNIPSVKLLAQHGVEEMIKQGREMGITSWEDKNRFGLSLALGSGEVKMTELASAYSIFANNGNKVELNPIEEVQNYLGETVYKKEIEEKRVIDEEYAYIINEALSDNIARAPIFGTNSKLNINGKKVAVKTGTTNSLRDNWCIGWTPSYLVAAWVGNNDNSPMSWVASGISGATPIWNLIMTDLLNGKDKEEWQQPGGVIKKKVCGKEGFFVAGTEDKIVCPVNISPTPTGT